MEILQPSCKFCIAISRLNSVASDNLPRIFCLGERKIKGVLEIDNHNLCIYTPGKGFVQFEIYDGDCDFFIALFLGLKKKMMGEAYTEPNLKWLDKKAEEMLKEAKAPISGIR